MPKAIRIHEYGGPEVLRYEEIDIPPPGEGEVRLRQRAIGVNFADIHTREGRYPLPFLPHPIGGEAMGVVETVGAGVTEFSPGDRVCYSTGGHALPRGAYAEARILPADRLVRLPDDIDDQTGAAIITKGVTAHYLLTDVYPVARGDTVLVHAAAGGVGSILVQWARHLGARVIGVTSTAEKAAAAEAAGCHHTIISTGEGIADRVRSLTGGEGVPVVYDAVGKDTFEESLRSLRPRGLLACYGTSSGPPPPLDLFRLNEMGSLYVTGAAYYWHVRDRETLLRRAADLFEVILSGAVEIPVNQRYALKDAATAHRDMENRRTIGMSVLLP